MAKVVSLFDDPDYFPDDPCSDEEYDCGVGSGVQCWDELDCGIDQLKTPKRVRESDSDGSTKESAGLPIAKSGEHSASSSTPTSISTPSAGSPESVEKPCRRRLRFKQTTSSDSVSPVMQKYTICGVLVDRHPLLKKYLSLDAKNRRLASKRVSQARYRLVNDLKENGRVEFAERTFEVAEGGVDLDAVVSDLDYVFFMAIAKDTARHKWDRGYAMSKIRDHMNADSYCIANNTTGSNVIRVGGLPSLLLTYQGDFGVLSHTSVKSALGVKDVSTSSETDYLDKVDVDTLALALSTHPEIQALAAKFEDLCVRTTNKLRTDKWAFSLELCTRTFSQLKTVRVHAHVWVMANRQTVLLNELLMDNKHSPFLNMRALAYFGGGGGRSAVGHFQGHFYVTVPKIGSILRKSDLVAWQDYPVRDTWVTTLYASGKISGKVAKACYYKCVHRCVGNLQLLSFCEDERDKQLQEAEALQVELRLRAEQKPWKRYEVVDQWAAQFERFQARYKCLVLDGPSSTGKSRFAICQTAVGKSWYCDCSQGVAMLRGFKNSQFDTIVLDELCPSRAMLLKKALQSSNEVITLGSSPTMVSSYHVRLFAVRIIICCNLWKSQLEVMSPEDQDWLAKNTFYLKVDSQMWQD
jgi:hypothetical protein